MRFTGWLLWTNRSRWSKLHAAERTHTKQPAIDSTILSGFIRVRRLALHSGEHISLNPVSKADGILAKIFIYNILQQRLDRLLLAVLRRERGRSVHEWDCRLGGEGVQGCVQGRWRRRSWGPGKQGNTSTRQQGGEEDWARLSALRRKARLAARWEDLE